MTPYDPGRDAAERYPDWVIRHRPLGGTIPEVMCRRRKTILVETTHDWPSKRCSLAHAVAHLDLEHQAASSSSTFDRWMEREANGLAALRLIPIEALARVLCWTRDAHEIAHELVVDLATLETRRRHLHESERGYLRRTVTWLEETARRPFDRPWRSEPVATTPRTRRRRSRTQRVAHRMTS